MARLLIRQPGLAGAALIGMGACAAAPPPALNEQPVIPLPIPALAGVRVTVYPLTLMRAEPALGWDTRLNGRVEVLGRADSVIAAELGSRVPEVQWVWPDALRRAARRAGGLVPDPDRMATAVLRGRMIRVPDPLRSQMRLLTGTAGDRFALVPASLFFLEDEGRGRAELSIALVDVRSGEVRWQTVARGRGTEPWAALARAIEGLTPGVP